MRWETNEFLVFKHSRRWRQRSTKTNVGWLRFSKSREIVRTVSTNCFCESDDEDDGGGSVHTVCTDAAIDICYGCCRENLKNSINHCEKKKNNNASLYWWRCSSVCVCVCVWTDGWMDGSKCLSSILWCDVMASHGMA